MLKKKGKKPLLRSTARNRNIKSLAARKARLAQEKADSEAGVHYVLRYAKGTPYELRGHTDTLGVWFDWAEADKARRERPSAFHLEVVKRDRVKKDTLPTHKIGAWRA